MIFHWMSSLSSLLLCLHLESSRRAKLSGESGSKNVSGSGEGVALPKWNYPLSRFGQLRLLLLLGTICPCFCLLFCLVFLDDATCKPISLMINPFNMLICNSPRKHFISQMKGMTFGWWEMEIQFLVSCPPRPTWTSKFPRPECLPLSTDILE